MYRRRPSANLPATSLPSLTLFLSNALPPPCVGRQAICHRLGCAGRARPHPVCVPDLSSGREHTMEHTADGSLPQTLSPTDSERQWAALAHLSALVLALMTSWIAGAAGVLAAVVVYMIKIGSAHV